MKLYSQMLTLQGPKKILKASRPRSGKQAVDGQNYKVIADSISPHCAVTHLRVSRQHWVCRATRGATAITRRAAV